MKIDAERASANRQARDERKRAHLHAVMDRYTARFRALAGADALAVAREAHAALDALLERDRANSAAEGTIRCRKGCSHCCHGPVEIWPHEAALLVAEARAAGIPIDPGRLERQAAQSVDTWRAQPAGDTGCAFLGADGACRVYESRPNACRRLLVTSEPALCDTANGALERVERWYSWEAEMMEVAAQDMFGADLMPRLVLAELAGK
ncbi:MAG: YkgJ family cysteine cluster protein [Burkholderiales bacterium]|nr:YkgJ family cysteine cluster protein [Burkholderiales bacterium]